MLKANYHTHTMLCNHATGMPKDIVEKAIACGYEELGFSEHNPVPVKFVGIDKYFSFKCNRNMSYDVFENVYLPKLDECIAEYKDKIKIYKGLECEFISDQLDYYKNLRSKVDYLNLGLHFFKDGETVYNSYYDVTYKNIDKYVKTAVEAIKTGLFKIFVHPDVYMFSYKDEDGKRTFDEHCLKAARTIIETCIEHNIYLEMNINGINNSRKFSKDGTILYPEIEFWKIVKEYPEAKVIFGVDAHSLEALDNDDIKVVEDMAKSIELNVLTKVEI